MLDKYSLVKGHNNIRKIDKNLLVINSITWNETRTLDGFNKHLNSTLENFELILIDFQKIQSHYISH